MDVPKNLDPKKSLRPDCVDASVDQKPRKSLIPGGVDGYLDKGARKSILPSGLDRKTINRMMNQTIAANDDEALKRRSMRPSAKPSLEEAPKTKYEKEKSSASASLASSDVHQALLDSSCVFRARTAIPHGLLFDLYEEVYPIIELMHHEYKKCANLFGRVSNTEMEEMVDDAENALSIIGKHIGKDCEDSSKELSTNKIYADAKCGIEHVIEDES